VKRLALVAALAGLAAAGTACDLSPPAATVAGTTVTTSELDAQLSAIAGSPFAQCTLQLQGVTISPQGAGEQTVSSSLSSFVLSTLVLQRLVESDLARRGHPVTAADLAAARRDLASQLSSSSTGTSPCSVSGAQLVDRMPGAFRDQQVQFLADKERLGQTLGKVDLSQASMLAYYRAHPTDFQELCLSDIAVQTQAQAQQIHDAIASGSTAFAAAAQQSSLDSGTAANGGQLPCVASSQITNPVITSAIAGLTPGQITPPVFDQAATPGGNGVWLVLQLDARPTVPFATAQPQIRSQLLAPTDSLVSAEFSRLVVRAKVTVDPRFGKWSAAQGVQPPTPPPSSLLLSPTSGSAASGGPGGG
jgi:parvulin-like peptidyl-prolyl isomerase